MEYEREPQKVSPSLLPFSVLAESVASTTYMSGPRFTYAIILLTYGVKLRIVLSQTCLTVIVNVKVACIFTPEPGDVS